MVTTIDDLPRDLSSDECEAKDVILMGPKTRAPPCKKRKASHPPRAAQQPTKKSAPSSTTESPKTDNLISLELARSIDGASVRALRDLLKKVCRENVEARKLVEEQLLSEEDKEKLRQLDEDEYFSDQTTESLRESRERWRRNRLEISGDWGGHSKFLDEAGELFRQFAHYDQSVLPKAKEDAKRIEATLHPHSNHSATFPACLNCGKKFNPRTNFHGECKWHSGMYLPQSRNGYLLIFFCL